MTSSTQAPRTIYLPAWLIGLLLLVTLPTAGMAQATSDTLGHLLERMDAEVAALEGQIPDAETKEQLLRQIRYLHHLALKTGAGDETHQRLETLELQIQTGRSGAPAGTVDKLQNLDKVGTITGQVTRSSDGSPIPNVELQLRDENFSYWDFSSTNASGQYTLNPPQTGEYYVLTYNSAGFLNELYDNVPCDSFGGDCQPSDGTPIAVGEQGTAQANFALALGGIISGTVTSAKTGDPLDFVEVRLWTDSGATQDYAYTDSLGQFEFRRLTAGNHFVTVDSYGSHRDELYDDIPCPDAFACGVTAGTPVAAAPETTTTGIDFVLEELGKITGVVTDAISGDPIPSQEIVAYNSEGFYSGQGYTDENGRYTIAGLDAGTHYVATGYSPWGFDAALFDNRPCPNGNCDPTTGTPIPVQLNETTPGADFVLEGGCVESQTVMCLNSNRFRVEADWRTNAGNTGPGRVVELTSDSGYLWFFGSNNIEIVVKVLDACTLPGANNFWVFAGGLTDVEVTLTVTDSQSGQVRTYANPIGTPFQPIQDTAAFDTCP